MKKHFGFTFAELLICMVIIGILMATAIFTFRPFDKGIKYLYSNTFYALDRAIYNAHESWIPQDSANRDPFTNTNISSGTRTKRLCLALTEYINYIEDEGNICNGGQITAAANDEQFNDENLQFTAVNGVRYYISQMYRHNNEDDMYYEDASGKHNRFVHQFFGDQSEPNNRPAFFIVYADLNGAKNPNSMNYEKTLINNGREYKYKDPDIFAFAVLDIGRVCPIGVTEVEPRYLTTRIKYRTTDPNDESQRIVQFSFPSRPYVYSKAEAWAYYISTSTDVIEDPEGDNTEQNAEVADDPNNLQITPEEPLSYNDYIKYVIEKEAGENGSAIYRFLGGKTLREYLIDNYHEQRDGDNDTIVHYINLYFRGDEPLDGGEHFDCLSHNIDRCEVFVDKYIH